MPKTYHREPFQESMNTFPSIALNRHKGLRGGELLGLEKINVFCGPNNSGKTTVLECIADPKHHMIGKAMNSTTVEQIEQSYMIKV